MIKINFLQIVLVLGFMGTLASCGKQNEWLDEKRQKEMVIPETLKDYQAILDQFNDIHSSFSIFGLVGADDILLNDADFNRSPGVIRNGYIWNKEVWENDISTQWRDPFEVILKSNIVFDGIEKIKPTQTNVVQYDDIKGQAYFYRAIFYYNLVQLFCKQYDKNSADALGLPLRTTSDVNIIKQRSNLKETFDFMLSDALEATKLLPVKSINNRRPSKAAAFALLAKIYLTMGDYQNAESFATEAIKIESNLLDFNSGYVSANLTFRFPADPYDHPEIIFYGRGPGFVSVMPSISTTGTVNPELYQLYDEKDLRKSLFYFINTLGQVKYRGSYTGSTYNFCGIATNELYLIRAESYARLGKVEPALKDLNFLLKNRYEADSFKEIVTSDADQLLEIIVTERRKELIGVGNMRWEDLKRLNKESRFQKKLSRNINNQVYTLEPNSLRYILPIPNNEVQISNITQNER